MKNIILIFIVFCTLILPCQAVNNGGKKSVSQSTSQENKIRKQQFNLCIASGKSRAYCYYLYY